MNASIRRLALDINPELWGYILLMVCMAGVMDIFWLLDPFVRPPLMAGLFLSLGAFYSAQKVALWRTLPVSQRQIDLARWLQGVLVPWLLSTLMLTVPALAMAFLGTLRAATPDIALMVAAQAGSGAILFGTTVSLPALAGRIGRFSVVPFALATGLIVFSPRFFHGDSARSEMGVIALFGLVVALLLYATAGRWPLPFIGWTELWARHGTRNRPAARGVSGWPALLMAQMPAVLLCWCLIPGQTLVMRFALGEHGDLSFMALIGFLVGALLPATAFAQGMRALRALPLSSVALTFRIMASLVAFQLIGAIIFTATLALLQPEYPPRPDYALLPVPLPMLIFTLALRFGPRIAQYSAAIAIFVVSTGAFLLQSLNVSVADTALIVVLTTGLSSVLAWRETVSGRHAYRAQPLIPLSWRGR